MPMRAKEFTLLAEFQMWLACLKHYAYFLSLKSDRCSNNTVCRGLF